MIQLPEFRMSHDEQIVPMRYEHLFDFEFSGDTIEYIENIPDYARYVWDNSQEGWSWTAIGRGKKIAIFGFRDIWDGLVEAWFIPGQGLSKHSRSTLVGARAIMEDAISQTRIRRLQITVKKDNDTAFKFAKALGFEVESIMRKFGPEGADYYMMARFK